MLFSIVTPSFRNSQWLKLCIASVADQQGVAIEHIVQDSCSDDGTQDWLPKDTRVKAFIEKDKGMYDAINRGLRQASGDIVSYLNCDEQYLPGALQTVQRYFEAHPNIDLVFSDVFVIDPLGKCLCYRKVQIPLKHHTMVSHLSTFTCSTFFRRHLLEKHDMFFDPKYRDLGDVDWVLRAIEKKIPMGVLRHFTSAFAETGDNMNLRPNGRREAREIFDSAPLWARKLYRVIEAHHRVRRLLGGIYSQKPFRYEIYTQQSPNVRVQFDVAKPTFRWKRNYPKTGSAPEIA